MASPPGSSQRSQEAEKLGAAEIDFWYNELIKAQIAAFILRGDLGRQTPSTTIAAISTGDQAVIPSAHPSVRPSAEPLDQPDIFEGFVNRARVNLKTVLAAKNKKEFVYLTADDWISWYDKLFQALIGVATLGAGFTFTVITSDMAKPHDRVNKEYVRRCVSVSLLLFVASLGCSSLAALFLSVNKRTFIRSIDKGDKWYKEWEGTVIVLTTLLV